MLHDSGRIKNSDNFFILIDKRLHESILLTKGGFQPRFCGRDGELLGDSGCSAEYVIPLHDATSPYKVKNVSKI